MKRIIKVTLATAILLTSHFALAKFSTEIEQVINIDVTAQTIHAAACSEPNKQFANPWHITNLYDCSQKTLFMPYQLWTGAKWDGDKEGSCSHAANTNVALTTPKNTDKKYSRGSTLISDPFEWTNSHTGETLIVWERNRTPKNRRQYYECHSRGIGKVHKVHKPNSRYVRGLCHAPGGKGWQIGVKRTCIKTTIEIVNVTLDENNELETVTYNYWYRDKLKHRYTNKRDYGAIQTLNYPKAN